MKKYRNERHGFEIDIPLNWFPTPDTATDSPSGECIMLAHDSEESVNIIIGTLVPEPGLDQNENDFYKYAFNRRYVVIKVNRITAGGKEHVCAAYIQPGNVWTKKYMINFNEIEYAITAVCFRQETFLANEAKWDSIVNSFTLIPHKKPVPRGKREKTASAEMYFEHGYSLFRAGKYKEAIEQFEKGQFYGNVLPGNYFGVAATIMQMLEKNLIPRGEIRDQLLLAEKNINVCLDLRPHEQDYINVHKAIIEKKKEFI